MHMGPVSNALRLRAGTVPGEGGHRLRPSAAGGYGGLVRGGLGGASAAVSSTSATIGSKTPPRWLWARRSSTGYARLGLLDDDQRAGGGRSRIRTRRGRPRVSSR